MFVKGLDGQSLSTVDTTVNMGYNNRAIVTDFPYDN